MANPDHVVVVHYSCESFYDRPAEASPRITSIAVRNLASGQTVSFSIHQVAEVARIPQDQIEDRFNDLERQALDAFYEYVHAHTGYTWLHWNMRDINYGFQAIAHRLRVLGGVPIDIPEGLMFDLARAMVAIYGLGYIGHPRLQGIVEKNHISAKDFLSGEEEARAFEARQYFRLHQSTLRKVDILANIAERADQGWLKTETNMWDQWKLYPQAFGEWLKEHWLASILLAGAAVAGLVLAILQLFR
jgi:hypothetical protein